MKAPCLSATAPIGAALSVPPALSSQSSEGILAAPSSAPSSARVILLSTAEVATMFRRTPRTIRTWIKQTRVPIVRIGRAVFIRQDEVNKLLGIEFEEFERK